MPGAFEPGPRSLQRHFRTVAGGAVLLLAVGGYLSVRAGWRAAGFAPQAGSSPAGAEQKP